MDELTIFNVMRPIILSITGVPECILAYQNKTSPDGPYAAVQPKRTVTQRGQANIERANGVAALTVDEIVKSQVIAECSVQFYRDGAKDYANKLFQAHKRSDVFAALFKADLGWNRSGSVNDLTALQADNWEQRAQISIYLMYEEFLPVTVNSIERVAVIVENEDADTLATLDVASPDAP